MMRERRSAVENYIVINGQRLELTQEQLTKLGINIKPVKVLGDYTMEDVLDIIKSGKATTLIKPHDVIKIAGYELEVIGFNHDMPVGDPMRHTITVMAKKLLERHTMHSAGECKRGWLESHLREWLNTDVLNALPEEIQDIIQYTKRTTYDSLGRKYETCDKLFVPSESELFGSAIYSPCMAGERYTAFRTFKDRVRFNNKGCRSA